MILDLTHYNFRLEFQDDRKDATMMKLMFFFVSVYNEDRWGIVTLNIIR